MPAERDPLSEEYDEPVLRLLRRAARSKPPRIVETFVYSPPREFATLDRGGRTGHERAFTRSVYYITYKIPVRLGEDPEWSAKITWGKIQKRSRGWGRPVKVRLFPYGRGYRKARRSGQTWITDQGQGTWRRGNQRSLIGARVDD